MESRYLKDLRTHKTSTLEHATAFLVLLNNLPFLDKREALPIVSLRCLDLFTNVPALDYVPLFCGLAEYLSCGAFEGTDQLRAEQIRLILGKLLAWEVLCKGLTLYQPDQKSIDVIAWAILQVRSRPELGHNAFRHLVQFYRQLSPVFSSQFSNSILEPPPIGLRESKEHIAGWRHTNDKVDFREIEVVPVIDELLCQEEPFFLGFPNPPRSSNQHLEYLFRELRQALANLPTGTTWLAPLGTFSPRS